MAKVIMYTKENCGYCTLAKDLLNAKQIQFEEVRVDLDENRLVEMVKLSGKRTVPQIFINDEAIGGYEDLAALAKSGKLDEFKI